MFSIGLGLSIYMAGDVFVGLSDTFARSLLSENGYFIGFWHFQFSKKFIKVIVQVEYIKVKNYMYFTAVSGQAIYFLKGQRNVT